MEEEVKRFSKSLGGFCSHLQCCCDALNRSLLRRPIPLDSASSTFTQSLNRRLSSVSTELNLLETMSFGTVSFEELLGHCNVIYRQNQQDLLHLQDRLTSFGYVPETEIVEDENEESGLPPPPSPNSHHSDERLDPSPYPHSITKTLEEDPLHLRPKKSCTIGSARILWGCHMRINLMNTAGNSAFLDESFNLKNLGLSDACLATLASEANDKVKESDMFSLESKGNPLVTTEAPGQLASKTSVLSDEVQNQLERDKTPGSMMVVSKEDYECLPSYMKCLASWEDLVGAVEKINGILRTKEKRKGGYYNFSQDEIQTAGLGNKEKAYMLLLMRMNRFVVETTDGVISYRVA